MGLRCTHCHTLYLGGEHSTECSVCAHRHDSGREMLAHVESWIAEWIRDCINSDNHEGAASWGAVMSAFRARFLGPL
jgi:hypothetical protein